MADGRGKRRIVGVAACFKRSRPASGGCVRQSDSPLLPRPSLSTCHRGESNPALQVAGGSVGCHVSGHRVFSGCCGYRREAWHIFDRLAVMTTDSILCCAELSQKNARPGKRFPGVHEQEVDPSNCCSPGLDGTMRESPVQIRPGPPYLRHCHSRVRHRFPDSWHRVSVHHARSYGTDATDKVMCRSFASVGLLNRMR